MYRFFFFFFLSYNVLILCQSNCSGAPNLTLVCGYSVHISRDILDSGGGGGGGGGGAEGGGGEGSNIFSRYLFNLCFFRKYSNELIYSNIHYTDFLTYANDFDVCVCSCIRC